MLLVTDSYFYGHIHLLLCRHANLSGNLPEVLTYSRDASAHQFQVQISGKTTFLFTLLHDKILHTAFIFHKDTILQTLFICFFPALTAFLYIVGVFNKH